MNRPWEVVYVHDMGYGQHVSEEGRTQHRTFVGADFYRRFRYHHVGMGACRVDTFIARTADAVAWDSWAQAEPPSYARVFDRLWPALYFLRSRWDGLRRGLDRDRRR